VSPLLDIMKVSSRLSISPAITIGLSAVVVVVVVVAIAIILLASNVTMANAQQQQQQVQQQSSLTSQPAVTQNGTTLFQNTEDSIRVQVPEGWVIHDVNNTGSTLLEESTQGYGILAQLCPQEEEEEEQSQQQRRAAAPATLSNVSGSSGGSDTSSCQGSEGGDIIHIVRYPDLNTRIQATNNATTTNSSNNNTMTTDNILLSYHLQKLQEVGYSGIEIVNSTDTTLNVVNAQTNQTITTVPAKSAEITYSTNSAPNETRIGYFILAATNATAPNLGTTTKGYSVFYEGNSTTTANSTTAAETTTTTTIPFGSLALATPLPAPVRQVFDSFELVTAAPSRPIPPPPPPAAPPTAPLEVEITSDDTEEVAPATFEFDADVTGGTEPYTYSWDFDGDSSEESDEQTVSHTFEEAGTYDVDLTVTDSADQTGSDSMEITVEEVPAAPAEEEEQEEEEDNNAGSNELSEADEIIDDIFDRLGIR
jgi:PKD repeat protein